MEDARDLRLAARGLTDAEAADAVRMTSVDDDDTAALDDPSLLGLTESFRGPDTSPFHMFTGMSSTVTFADGEQTVELVGRSGRQPSARELLWFFEGAELRYSSGLATLRANIDGRRLIYRAHTALGSFMVLFDAESESVAFDVLESARFEDAENVSTRSVGTSDTTDTTR